MALTLTALVVAAGAVLLVASYVLVRANINGTKLPRGGLVPAGGTLHPVAPPGSGVRVEIAHHTLSTLVWEYSAIGAALIVVAALVAWLLAGRILRPYDGKATAEVHDYHDELTGVLAASLAKRAPGYTSLGFPDPRKLPYTPSASTASNPSAGKKSSS